MPQTVFLADAKKGLMFEAVVVARKGRWVVTKTPSHTTAPFTISETRTGRKLDSHETKKSAVAALARLDLVCPNWIDRDRFQSAEYTEIAWKEAGTHVSRPLFVASRGVGNVPGVYIDTCVSIVQGVYSCPDGLCVKGIAALFA